MQKIEHDILNRPAAIIIMSRRDGRVSVEWLFAGYAAEGATDRGT